MAEKYDKIIIGAGLYGMYAADRCAAKGQSVLVLEYDPEPFQRATYINQARVHMGYHYPRSLTTAVRSAGYFKRFTEDFDFCIHNRFDQVYATSASYSWTNAEQFVSFCRAAGIKCEEVAASKYFKANVCDGAFLTEEYTYDARLLMQYFRERVEGSKNVRVCYGARIRQIRKEGGQFLVQMQNDDLFEAPFVLNATYASVNQIIHLTEGVERKPFDIKYELCEIILCRPSEALKNVGLTVMDGPFFSIMPFGKTAYHSLTAVTFTPHVSSTEITPKFGCQENCFVPDEGGRSIPYCTPQQLGNCDACPHKPRSAWNYMSHLADKYMKPEYAYQYEKSLFSMKPVLKSSEVDDSRPTAVRVMSREPYFVSVLSGKINTVYDLDDYLD